MSESVRLDHVGVGVRSLDQAAAAYERLGFTLSPYAQHAGADTPGGPNRPLGTGNRCAMLREGYIELISVVDPRLPSRGFPERLARYEGIHIVAFETDDPPATDRRLREAGFGARGTQYLERPVDTPAGQAMARFDRVPVPEAEMPEGRIFYIQHLTPEVIWQPPLLVHENGATGLAEVMIRVADLDQAAVRYARFLDNAPQWSEGVARFDLARGICFLLDDKGVADMLPGLDLAPSPAPVALTVTAADLGRTAGLLEARGVPFRRREGRLVVDPAAAGGTVLLFAQG